MKHRYEHTGLYAFLEVNGADFATAEQLTELRKQYWRDYKRQWKADRRRKNYAVTIFFSARELTILDRNVAQVRISRPKYIKKLALKDLSLPDTKQLRSLLFGNYEALLALCRNGNVPPDIGAQLLCRMDALEQAVISQLQISFADVG